jgi:hypothetical protein
LRHPAARLIAPDSTIVTASATAEQNATPT